MNYLDAILAIPLLWFTYKGFSKGLIIELATLIALLLGIYISAHFSDYTADFLRQKLDFHSEYMSIISFSLTFVGVVFLVMIFGKSLEKVINVLLLGFINKILGGVFGLIKVAFILSIFIFILTTFEVEQKLIKPSTQEKSLLYPPIKLIAPTVFPVIKESNINFLDKLDDAVHNGIDLDKLK
ncbi:MAG: CvpA family protein [Bacteroidales bacterium]|nr:CvpA family protein [Bacteroidales bacterium]